MVSLHKKSHLFTTLSYLKYIAFYLFLPIAHRYIDFDLILPIAHIYISFYLFLPIAHIVPLARPAPLLFSASAYFWDKIIKSLCFYTLDSFTLPSTMDSSPLPYALNSSPLSYTLDSFTLPSILDPSLLPCTLNSSPLPVFANFCLPTHIPSSHRSCPFFLPDQSFLFDIISLHIPSLYIPCCTIQNPTYIQHVNQISLLPTPITTNYRHPCLTYLTFPSSLTSLIIKKHTLSHSKQITNFYNTFPFLSSHTTSIIQLYTLLINKTLYLCILTIAFFSKSLVHSAPVNLFSVTLLIYLPLAFTSPLLDMTSLPWTSIWTLKYSHQLQKSSLSLPAVTPNYLTKFYLPLLANYNHPFLTTSITKPNKPTHTSNQHNTYFLPLPNHQIITTTSLEHLILIVTKTLVAHILTNKLPFPNLAKQNTFN